VEPPASPLPERQVQQLGIQRPAPGSSVEMADMQQQQKGARTRIELCVGFLQGREGACRSRRGFFKFIAEAKYSLA